MSAPLTDTRIPVADLLERPGVSRPVDAEFGVPDGLDLPLVDHVAPLRVRGVLESVVDGILVRGTLSTEMTVACARCLTPVTDKVTTQVAELYTDPEPGDDEREMGYEIRDGAIDLDPLLRDALVPAAPLAPRCREDCKGLCVTCGADLNEAGDHSHADDVDSRWAALQELRLEGGTAD